MSKVQNDHPVMILVRGLPGSGKTYIAAELAKAIGLEGVVVLDPDEVDLEGKEYTEHIKQQNEEGVDPKLHLYRFSRGKAYQGIEDHKIVIWNQPFTNLEIFNKMVGRMNDHAKEHNTELPILVVEVETDPVVAKERIMKRKKEGGHGPSDDTFTRFTNDYKTFANDGYNTVTVNGQDDVTTSVAKIMKSLQDLL